MRPTTEIQDELAGVYRQLDALRHRGHALELELAERESRGRPVIYWEEMLGRAKALEDALWLRWRRQSCAGCGSRKIYDRVRRVQALVDWVGERLDAAERVRELRVQADFLG